MTLYKKWTALCYLWVLQRGEIHIFKKLQRNDTFFLPKVSKVLIIGEIFDIYNINYCLVIAFSFFQVLPRLLHQEETNNTFISELFFQKHHSSFFLRRMDSLTRKKY